MLSANGFEITDLGADVPVAKFVDEAEARGAGCIAISALLTTTMSGQRRVVEELKKRSLKGKVRVMVGGAPCSDEWAREIGADGYAGDAVAAVSLAQSLMGAQMTKDFLATIKRRVVIFDGGMGSMLIAAGLTQREVPEAWVLSKSEKIGEVHAAYLEAGAEVVTTATFGASRLKLQSSEAGKKLDAARVNEKGVEIARKALERSGKHERFVAGDIGPTGLFFPPVGALKADEARAAFREQAKALARRRRRPLHHRDDVRPPRGGRGAARGEGSVEPPRRRHAHLRPQAAGLLHDDGGHDGDGRRDAAQGRGERHRRELHAPERRHDRARRGVQASSPSAPLLFQPNAGRPVMEHGVAVYKQRPREFAEDA